MLNDSEARNKANAVKLISLQEELLVIEFHTPLKGVYDPIGSEGWEQN